MRAWSRALTIDADTIAALHVQVAEDAGGIAGFYALERAGRAVQLEHLWVRPSGAAPIARAAAWAACSSTTRSRPRPAREPTSSWSRRIRTSRRSTGGSAPCGSGAFRHRHRARPTGRCPSCTSPRDASVRFRSHAPAVRWCAAVRSVRPATAAAAVATLAAIAVGAWLRWTPPAAVADLRPRPDALEYEDAARNLLRGEGYSMVVDGRRYPPRYPAGFPLLLVPALAVGGDVPGVGVVVVQAAAAGGIAATALLAAGAGGPASGVAAAWLLALAPLHVRWSRAVMSDVPAATAATLLALGLLRALARPRSGLVWLALGVGAGFAATIRAPLALLVPPAVLCLPRGGRLRPILALGAGGVLGMAPGALLAMASGGTALGAGYGVWVRGAFFGVEYLFGPPKGGGTAGNLPFYLRLLAGGGTLYARPVALLALAGIFVGLRRGGPARRLVVVAVGFTAALLAVHAAFFWQWDRFLLPALPLVLAVAALPLGDGPPAWMRAGALALVVVAGALDVRTPHAYDPPDRPLGDAAALTALAAWLPPDAAVIGGVHASLFDRILRRDADRVLVPVGLDEHRFAVAWLKPPSAGPARDDGRWLRAAMPDPLHPAAALDGIERLLAEGRPVFVVPSTLARVPNAMRILPTLAARFRLADAGAPVPGVLRVLPGAR